MKIYMIILDGAADSNLLCEGQGRHKQSHNRKKNLDFLHKLDFLLNNKTILTILLATLLYFAPK